MAFPNNTIEKIMQQYKPDLAADFDKYKNHVSRVYFNCLLIDPDKENEEKYAIAAVFHDIGIWTDNTIDYLNPSLEQACFYLNKNGKNDWIAEITLMINWHHKTSTYNGQYQKTVETFRRADWIDVSLGLINFGWNKKDVKENRKKFPNLGFHFFLVKKIFLNLFKHPLHPLPMFKK